MSKKKFNRDTKARRSLIHGVTLGVLDHGSVITTQAKAKEARRLIDSCISKAQNGDLATRRQLHRIFGRREVVNNLCDRIAPVFKDRQSGFTTLTLIGNRRGDNCALYKLSLITPLPPKKKMQDKEKVDKVDQKIKNKYSSRSKTIISNQQAKEAMSADSKKNEKIIKINPIKEKITTRNSVAGGGRGK